MTGAVSPPIYQTSTYAQDGVGRPRGGYEYARCARTRPASGSSGRSRRSRAGTPRDRLRQRLGGDGGDRPARGRAPTRSSSATTSTAARTATSSGSTGRSGAADARYVDLVGPPGPLWEQLTDRTRLVWFETPVEPEPQADRHRRRRADDPRAGRPEPAARGRSSSSTTRSPRRPSRTRSRSAPTSCSTRRRSTSAATRTRSSGSRSPATTRSPSGCASSRTRWAAVPGPLDCFLVLRGLRTLHLRVERHVAERHRDRARSSPQRDDVDDGVLPGPGGRAACPSRRPSWSASGRQMRAGGGMVSFIPPRRRTAASAAERAVAIARGDPALHAGGVARRRRVARRGPGDDDPRLGRRLASRGRSGARPPVGRDRERRRPDRGPAERARRGLASRPGPAPRSARTREPARGREPISRAPVRGRCPRPPVGTRDGLTP